MPYWMPRKLTLQDEVALEQERLNITRQKIFRPPPEPNREVPAPISPTEMRPIQWQPPVDQVQQTESMPWEPMMPQAEQATEQMPWQPIQMPSARIAPQQAQQVTPQVQEPVIEGERKWWQGPEEKVGEFISKVPLLPEALQFVAPAFEWVQEKLEKPWAAVITAPFSPSLPWRQGESWIAHQRREYDAWDAPDYVKGGAEVSMPLWWLPWTRIIRAGGSALGIGEKALFQKATTAIAKNPKLQTVAEHGLPTSNTLDQLIFNAGRLRSHMAKVPIVNKMVKVLGGEGAFITKAEAKRVGALGKAATGADAVTATKMALVRKGYIDNMSHGIGSLLVPKIQALGNIERVLGLNSKGIVSRVVDKSGRSQYLYDVLEGAMKNPENYTFVDDASRIYVETLGTILDDVYALAVKEGIKVPKGRFLHRIVKGKHNPDTGRFEATEFGSLFDKSRVHKLQKYGVEGFEGVGGGIEYGLNINESITSTINHYVKQIARKRFDKEIKNLSSGTAKHMWETSPEGQMLRALKENPERLTEFEESMAGVTEFYGGKATADDMIRQLSIDKSRHMKHYAGREAFSTKNYPFEMAKFHMNPSFGARLFPKEVVKTAEKLLGDDGQKWLTNMSTISGTSRMLVAAMDLSAPFIQGVAILGSNPIAWAKGVTRMLEFAAKPQNFYKYMANPEIMATRMERIMAGGSSSTFEYFQALSGLQRVAGRVPVVGKNFDKLIGATYGRAETAFTGFGEVARNNMWKALKKPGMTPEQLGDLARTIDRMTGVMSTEALAIGRTQRDFENAFVFFAPRYTRAGLSFASDILKGGMAGAEARVALGQMASGGLAMYYAACRALGQQPNLNPNSGRFLTIKVGDSHVGIGGIMIALMRFGYDIGITAVEDPINLVQPMSGQKLNRWDNPFIRFMYSRTAPLTSTLYSAIVEQADYFGEPFENAEDWANFMRDKITPIAVQGFLEDPSLEVAGAEVIGLRAFPKSPWELVDEKRDELSMQEHNLPYDQLNELQQMRIDRNDTVQKLQEDVDNMTVTRGDKENVAFINWERERESARLTYESNITDLQNAYDAGTITGYDFREQLAKENYGLGMTYDHIISQPEYRGVREILDKPRKVGDKHIQDIAYQEYTSELFKVDKNGRSQFEDEFGIFQYDKYNAFINEFKERYDEEIYEYILERKAEKDLEMPPLYHEYQKAKIVLQPYWQVASNVERLFGKAFAESRAGQRLITRQHDMLKLQNPEIARYIALFYTR